MQLRRRRYKTAILLAGRTDPLGDATDPDARRVACRGDAGRGAAAVVAKSGLTGSLEGRCATWGA